MKKKYLFFLWAMAVWSVTQAQKDSSTTQWRPLYHFTPEKNWTNDPNGLIYIDDNYHMYNQQNPFENKWGHMSWGHATSTDLIHWKHFPIAIPETIDKDTTWRFSGSAVKDISNSSSFCKTPGCIVAIYTADQPNLKTESQFIAFSNDGGMSFTNYPGNPVIDLHKKDFRDPNVSWNKQLQKWLMVVALTNEHKVIFFTSVNLKEWDLLNEFGDAGYSEAGWECPSLVEIPIEGEQDKHKWVLFVSAAGPKKGPFMQYFVGDFDGRSFKNDNLPSTILTVDYGDTYYAAIPWNDQPDGKKIMIGWMVPGKQKTSPWTGQMSIPKDLSLRQTINGYRLIQMPCNVIEKKLDSLSEHKVIRKSEINIDDVQDELIDIPGKAFWLDAELVMRPGTDVGFTIGKKRDNARKAISETAIGYNSGRNLCYVDRSLSGNAYINKKDLLKTVELEKADSVIRIQILFDKSSLEIFFGNGEKLITIYNYTDLDASLISMFAKKGQAKIKNLTIWDLSGIKND